MSRFTFFTLFISISLLFSQQTQSYSWEDGETILGSYGNLTDAMNVGETNGVSPYDGNSMLTVSESPLSGTPQAFIGYVTELNEGDEVTACYYGYDVISSNPSLRIWGNYASNDDITSYAGSASGNSTYSSGIGWEQLCHTWTIPAGKEALVIQARLYSASDDPTQYFIDLVEITAPDGAIINFPGMSGGNQDLPISDAGSNQQVDFGSLVTLDGSGSSDNGSIIGYTWYQEEGPLVNLSSYEDDIVTFTAPDNFATLVFSLEVIDNEFNVSEPSFVTIMVMEPISIHDIQYTTDQGEYCYETALAGQTVSISGVVTHVNSSGTLNLFVQDPNTDELWSGITVFGDLPAEASLPNVGDSVDIVGMVNEYYSLTQITDMTALNITSSGEEITPISVNASDIGIGCSESGEMHESMLVTLSDVTFVSVDEYGNWIVSDGSGETMVDDYHFQGTFPNISVGDSFECMTGVVSYSYSEFKVYPRDINDFCGSEDFGCTDPIAINFNPDADIDDGSCEYETVEMTIHDIQYTTDPGEYCYETPLEGQTVSISGVVTHVNSSGTLNLFVQDPNTDELWSGITVFGDLPAEASLPDVGDSVDIVGMVNEYYSLTQIIDIEELNITSSDEEITPISVNASDIGISCSGSGEMHESMLVTLSDVTFVSVDEFGNWIVSDSSGETMVDDYHFQGTFPNISVGDSFECMTGVVSYSYSEFKVYPRDINDFCGGGDDGGGTIETTIYDIQYTTDPGEYCYETALAGQSVSISGVVTHVSSNSSGVPNLFVQDPNTDELWSGITVFGDLPAEASLPDVGDSVDIVGMVNEYYSLTQITDMTELNITSSGEEITPISVNASDIGIGCSESGEMHESMLVTLSDVTFVSVDEFGNWIVSDSSGETMVDDYHFQGTFPNISVGDSFECMTGVVSYSYSEFKVYPRDINDFSCSECISDGDVNTDGNLDVLDVVMTVNYILGSIEFSDIQTCSADYNGDGGVDVLDIVTIVNEILN